MRVRYQVVLLTLLGVIGVLALVAPMALAQESFVSQETCPAFIDQALTQVGNNCANLGGSSACYGYGSVTPLLNDNAAAQFSQPTDRVGLETLRGLRTAGYDPNTGEVGVALLNVNANPASNTGLVVDDVKYILFGDVEVTNAVSGDNAFLLPELAPTLTTAAEAILHIAPGAQAPEATTLPSGASLLADGITLDNAWVHVSTDEFVGWVSSDVFDPNADLNSLPKVKYGSLYPMQSFNFSTSNEDLADCTGIPSAMLILQAPPDVTVEVVANGVPIRFTNTIFLRTTPDNAVDILNVSGDVILNAGEPSQTLFRAAGAVAARLGAQGTTNSYRLMTRSELESFNGLQALPSNILYAPVTIPQVVQGSPSTFVPPVVIPTNTPPFTPPDDPEEPPFPRPPLDPGPGGNDLPGSWTNINIGGETCPPWIIFHSDREGLWEIYRTSIGGGADVNLSNNPDDTSASIQPTRSNDGEWVAFTTNRDDGNWEIYVSSIDGTQTRRMTFNTGVDINPVWGPGDIIVFETNRDANWELYAFDVSSGAVERLTDYPEGADVDADWSSDGGNIVFSRDVNGNYELFVLNYATRQLSQLTDNSVDNIGAKFSNDGTKLAYLERDPVSGVYELHVADVVTNADGSVSLANDQALVELGADVNLATWAADDSYIVFESNVDGDYDIFAVDVETEEVKNVSNNPFQDRAPSILCASNNVIYQSDSADIQRNYDIFEIDPRPINANGPFSAPSRITTLPSNEIYAMNTPLDEDGSREGRLP